MTLSRQDSAGTGDGLGSLGARNTLPHSGHRGHRPGADSSVARSMSVPPKILHHTLTNPDNKVILSDLVPLGLKEKCEILKNIWINCNYQNMSFLESNYSEVTSYFALQTPVTKVLLIILHLFIIRN